jgi:hypothetical protein
MFCDGINGISRSRTCCQFDGLENLGLPPQTLQIANISNRRFGLIIRGSIILFLWFDTLPLGRTCGTVGTVKSFDSVPWMQAVLARESLQIKKLN